MQPTPYPDVNVLLEYLLARMQTVLGTKLVGLYLYGSLVTGDYDEVCSDVDLLAVLASALDEEEFEALRAMQAEFVAANPMWTERIEIAYATMHALQTFKTQASLIAIVSPGEPFHYREMDKDWLANWYVVREYGLTLFGPPPGEVIATVTNEEFVATVKRHCQGWRDWVNDAYNRPSQAYAILTLCRAWYTVTHGEQVSKLKAAEWAMAQLPGEATQIQTALRWRREAAQDDGTGCEATIPETKRFVNAMIERILKVGTLSISDSSSELPRDSSRPQNGRSV